MANPITMVSRLLTWKRQPPPEPYNIIDVSRMRLHNGENATFRYRRQDDVEDDGWTIVEHQSHPRSPPPSPLSISAPASRPGQEPVEEDSESAPRWQDLEFLSTYQVLTRSRPVFDHSDGDPGDDQDVNDAAESEGKGRARDETYDSGYDSDGEPQEAFIMVHHSSATTPSASMGHNPLFGPNLLALTKATQKLELQAAQHRGHVVCRPMPGS
jgi:hypothetical protein